MKITGGSGGGGGGGGNIDVENAGTPLGNFNTVNVTGAGATASDAGGGVAEINVPGGGSGVDVEDGGSGLGSFTTLNFAGAGVTAADAGGGEATITIPGGSSVDVEDEGSGLGAFTAINFVGAGVTASDAGGGLAEITIPGGGGGGVTGPVSSTDNTLARFDGTGGNAIQGSGIVVDDSDNVTGIGTLDTTGNVNGRDMVSDGAKLDGVEALADVTDTVNVDAAGAVMHTDFPSEVGFVTRTGSEAYGVIKYNLTATVAPTASDDSAGGYAVGSRWVDVSADAEYVCLDASVGAAVWTETTASGGGGGGTTAPTQTNAVYVSKAGNDSDDGLSQDTPKLTIGSAITAASGLTPSASNRVAIYIQDAGTYTENPSLPDYVSLVGPGATVEGDIVLGLESILHIHRVISTGSAVTLNVAGKAWITANQIQTTGGGSSEAIQTTATGAILYLDVGKITVSGGVAVYPVTGTSEWYGQIGEIEITGSGWGIYSVGGLLNLTIGRIWENGGTATDGIDLHGGSSVANLVVGEFFTTNSYEVDFSSTLNLFVSDLGGTPGIVLGTANIVEAREATGFTDETNAVYVSKAGDDSNDGLTLNQTKLTIGSAITAASGLTPSASNPVAIYIQDAGIYTENCTLPDYVSLIGSAATIVGVGSGFAVRLGLESTLHAHRVETQTGSCVYAQEQGKAWVRVDEIVQTVGTSLAIVGVRTNNNLTELYVDIGKITVLGGTAVNESFSGSIYGSIGEIEITGTGRGVYTDASGKVNLHIGRIFDSGSGTGIDIDGASTDASIFVGTIDCATTYAVTGSGSTLKLIAGELTGAVGTITGTANVLTP